MSAQSSRGDGTLAAPHVAGDPVPPPGYRLVDQHRLLGSVVSAVWESADGAVLTWASRRHRKRRTEPGRRAFGCAPRRLAWWIAVAFTAGSVCFVAGAAGAVAGPTLSWPNAAYFAGSLLFTAGAAAQLVETWRTGRDVAAPGAPPRSATLRAAAHSGRQARRLWVFIPGRLDWNASLIQIVGTVLFNINCFYGMYTRLSMAQEDVRVWVPSTVASVCFVVSSQLAFCEATGRFFAWRPRSLDWWITTGSLAGSWGFLLSSIAGFFLGGDLGALVTGVLGPHGETLWLEYIVDGALLAGSLCFLVGTGLMIPEALGAHGGRGAGAREA